MPTGWPDFDFPDPVARSTLPRVTMVRSAFHQALRKLTRSCHLTFPSDEEHSDGDSDVPITVRPDVPITVRPPVPMAPAPTSTVHPSARPKPHRPAKAPKRTAGSSAATLQPPPRATLPDTDAAADAALDAEMIETWNELDTACAALHIPERVNALIHCLREFPGLFIGTGTVKTEDLNEALQAQFKEGSQFLMSLHINVFVKMDGKKAEKRGATSLAKFKCKILVLLHLAFLMEWFHRQGDQVSVLWDHSVLDAFLDSAIGTEPLSTDLLSDIVTNLDRCGAGAYKGMVTMVSRRKNGFRYRIWYVATMRQPVELPAMSETEKSIEEFATRQKNSQIQWNWPKRI